MAVDKGCSVGVTGFVVDKGCSVGVTGLAVDKSCSVGLAVDKDCSVGLAVDKGCSVGVTVSIGRVGSSGGIARVESISLLGSDLSGSTEVPYNIKDQL